MKILFFQPSKLAIANRKAKRHHFPLRADARIGRQRGAGPFCKLEKKKYESNIWQGGAYMFAKVQVAVTSINFFIAGWDHLFGFKK